MDDTRSGTLRKACGAPRKGGTNERVDPECVMALSHAPYLFHGEAAVEAVTGTPEWDEVAFSNRHISRPQEGLIVVGYEVKAQKGDTPLPPPAHPSIGRRPMRTGRSSSTRRSSQGHGDQA